MSSTSSPSSLLSRPDLLARGPSLLARIDPRARLLAALGFSAVVALASELTAPALALAVAAVAAVLGRLRVAAVCRRLLPFVLLALVLFSVLPWTTPGEPVWRLGPLTGSREGLVLAAAIGLKGAAIILMLIGLLGTLDISVVGHAMSHLHVPEKLTHLMLFTVRYLDVMQQEFHRLAVAMKVRGFRPGINRHTYRTYGYLVGMVLARSFDRSERIVAAMKCRGFRGRFYLLDHFHYTWRDLPFALVSSAVLATLIWVQVR